MNQPKRLSLPNCDHITLSELATWLAVGKARKASRLLRLLRRNRGRREPRALWETIEGQAERIVSECRRGSLRPFGRADDGPHRRIPQDYFASDVYAEPATDSIAPDPLAWARGSFPEGLPTYQNVRFNRAEVESWLGGLNDNARDRAVPPRSRSRGRTISDIPELTKNQTRAVLEALTKKYPAGFRGVPISLDAVELAKLDIGSPARTWPARTWNVRNQRELWRKLRTRISEREFRRMLHSIVPDSQHPWRKKGRPGGRAP